MPWLPVDAGGAVCHVPLLFRAVGLQGFAVRFSGFGFRVEGVRFLGLGIALPVTF